MRLPAYVFNKAAEAGWAVFVAVAVVVLTELLTFNESTLTDPVAWGSALLAASIRAAAGALLALLKPSADPQV